MHRETHKNPEAYMLEDTRLEARDTEQERRSRRYLLDSLSQIKEVHAKGQHIPHKKIVEP